jgi:signal transduction histidine kinase
MRSRLRLSLVWKFLLAFVLVVLAGIATVSLLVRYSAVREVQGFVARGGFSDTQRVADYLSAYYQGRGSWEGVEPFFSDDSNMGHHMGGHMGGGIMGRMAEADLTLTDPMGMVIAGEHYTAGTMIDEFELPSRTIIDVDGETVGILYLNEGAFLGPEIGLLQNMGRSLVLAALIAGLVALVVGGLLVFNLLRPVRELTTAAQALSDGDLSRRVTVRGADELGNLSLTFNKMAANLERAESLRKEMTADIAHELRTPLAVIQARLEAILDGVNPSTTENLEAVLEQSHMLNRLVEDLGTLALADAGELVLERTDADLISLLRRVVGNHEELARAKEVEMRVDAGGLKEMVASVDPFRMEQVLSNILTNAIRHASDPGEVSLTVNSVDGPDLVRIEIMDDGEGIPVDAIDKVFSRFYRADKGRSRQMGGTGLGLAIARRLVEAHGGTIRAGNRPEGGAIFSVEIPLYTR